MTLIEQIYLIGYIATLVLALILNIVLDKTLKLSHIIFAIIMCLIWPITLYFLLSIIKDEIRERKKKDNHKDVS